MIERRMISATMLGLILMATRVHTITKISPHDNMWVTWANQTGQSAFCLSLATARDPFRTCLFGVPIGDPTELQSLFKEYVNVSAGSFYYYCNGTKFTGDGTIENLICKNDSTANNVVTLLKRLHKTLPWDPQELDLLGSVAVGNSSQNWTRTCFILRTGGQRGQWTNITSKTYGFDPEGPYCGYNDSSDNVTVFGAGVTARVGLRGPKALPPGIFLICGDRAWQGVPANPMGGPCYIGRLTLFAPNLHDQQWLNLTRAMQIYKRSKRSLTTLGSDCKDDVQLWGPAKRIFAAALAPGVAVAHAMTNLGKLACWAVKQSNVTTEIITELSQDMDSLRHAVLQNRAAIDFLLLAQGHGCEDFEGMCCFNLSDHGQSIHDQLKWLKVHTQKVTIENDWFEDIFRRLFGNIGGWFMGLIREGLRILLIIILIIIAAKIIFSCLTRKLEQLSEKVFLIQNKNGGIVEEWLERRGHLNIEQLDEDDLAKYRTPLV